MIVKQRDATPATINALQMQSKRATDVLTRVACSSAAARLKADPTTEAATELINDNFGESEEWAVLHDLRLRVGSHAVQVNHLLISNTLCCVCVDSRYLNFGLEFTNSGKCRAFNHNDTRLVASPLTKMARDMRMVRTHLETSDVLPRRFGLGPRATVRGYVLTDPASRIDPRSRISGDDIGVYSSDSIFPMLWKRGLRWSQTRLERLSPERLEQTALRLAEYHQPNFPRALLERKSPTAASPEFSWRQHDAVA